MDKYIQGLSTLSLSVRAKLTVDGVVEVEDVRLKLLKVPSSPILSLFAHISSSFYNINLQVEKNRTLRNYIYGYKTLLTSSSPSFSPVNMS